MRTRKVISNVWYFWEVRDRYMTVVSKILKRGKLEISLKFGKIFEEKFDKKYLTIIR